MPDYEHRTVPLEGLLGSADIEIDPHTQAPVPEVAYWKTIATTDGLTGLANRLYLTHTLDRLAVEMPGQFGVVFGDLDGLKRVNDTDGHEAGNELLRQAGKSLTRHTRHDEQRQDTVGVLTARLSGDEYAIAVPGVSTQSDLDAFTTRLMPALYNDGVSMSLAGAVHQPGTAGLNTLRDADMAMYEVKQERRRLSQEVGRMALPEDMRLGAEAAAAQLAAVGMSIPDFNRLYGDGSR